MHVNSSHNSVKPLQPSQAGYIFCKSLNTLISDTLVSPRINFEKRNRKRKVKLEQNLNSILLNIIGVIFKGPLRSNKKKLPKWKVVSQHHYRFRFFLFIVFLGRAIILRQSNMLCKSMVEARPYWGRSGQEQCPGWRSRDVFIAK